jgi:hypothetical protein
LISIGFAVFERRRQIVLKMHICDDASAIEFAIFSWCFLIVLVLTEQNCNPHGAFKANVNIEAEAFRGGSSCANLGRSNLLIKLTYFEDFGVLGCVEVVILIDFHAFCSVWATPTNRASEAFRGGPNRVNSGDSHLMKILVYFEYFNVFGGLYMVMLVDFHLFCSVWATPTNRAEDAHVWRCICDWICYIFLMFFDGFGVDRAEL